MALTVKKTAKKADANPDSDYPDAGRLLDFPHPRETDKVFGQNGALEVLRAARSSDRLHHAWLLSGPEGVGKATLAYDFARGLLSDAASEHAARTRGQIARAAHPNLLALARPYNEKTKKFSQTIPVAEVRRLKGFLGGTAGQAGYRAVIVDRADDLNISAANALLKSLEEPPAKTVFLLISSEPGRLLPTIRSRCRLLPCPPLDEAALQQAVEQACAAADVPFPPKDELARITGLASGSVRRALEFSTGEGVQIAASLLEIFARLPSLDFRKVHALADKITKAGADSEFELAFSLLLDLVRRLVRHASHPPANESAAPISPELQAAADRISPARGLAQWAGLWDTLVREKRQTLALNLDRKNFLLVCFERLRSVASDTMS